MPTSQWRDLPCPAFVDGSFSVWPHGGNIALGCQKGRMPEAGVVEELWSLARSTEARRRVAASGRQSRSSFALSHLETDRWGGYTPVNLPDWNIEMWAAVPDRVPAPLPARKGLWLPSMDGLNCPFWATARLWYGCGESWNPLCGCSTVKAPGHRKTINQEKQQLTKLLLSLLAYIAKRCEWVHPPCGYEDHQLNSWKESSWKRPLSLVLTEEQAREMSWGLKPQFI